MEMKTKQDYRGKEVEITFDSISEVNKFFDDYSDVAQTSHAMVFEKSHFCSESWDSARDKFTNGWKNGVQGIEKIKAEILRRVDSIDVDSFDIHYDVVGQFIDMGRVMVGDPESFGEITLMPQPKESIHIAVAASYAASIHQDVIYNRGAAICAIVEKLRRRYHVTIDLVRFVDYETNFYGFRTLKTVIHIDTTNEFSRDTLAFCLANAAYNRRIMFRVNEIVFNQSDCSTYGCSKDTKQEPGTLYFPVIKDNHGPYRSVETSIREVERILEMYNVKEDKGE